MAFEPDARYRSAREMAEALRQSLSDAARTPSSPEVAAWVERVFGDHLSTRKEAIRQISEMSGPMSVSALSSQDSLPTLPTLSSKAVGDASSRRRSSSTVPYVVVGGALGVARARQRSVVGSFQQWAGTRGWGQHRIPDAETGCRCAPRPRSR